MPTQTQYTGAGGTSSTCSFAACPTNCPYYQYTAGCTGASPGTCTNCTNALVGNYYSGTGGWSNNCQNPVLLPYRAVQSDMRQR